MCLKGRKWNGNRLGGLREPEQFPSVKPARYSSRPSMMITIKGTGLSMDMTGWTTSLWNWSWRLRRRKTRYFSRASSINFHILMVSSLQVDMHRSEQTWWYHCDQVPPMKRTKGELLSILVLFRNHMEDHRLSCTHNHCKAIPRSSHDLLPSILLQIVACLDSHWNELYTAWSWHIAPKY